MTGMDQLKAVRGLVDVAGQCLNDFHVAKGAHQSLMSAIAGDTINILWMADNSIPVSDKYKRAAIDCVETASVLATQDFLSTEPLVLTTRRAIQLHATCLQNGSSSAGNGEVLVQPLLARSLLDCLVLVCALHRASQPAVSVDNADQTVSSSNGDIAAALTAKYFDNSSNSKPRDIKMEPSEQINIRHSGTDSILEQETVLIIVCKWIILARLTQLVALEATENVLDAESSAPVDANVDLNENAVPLDDIVRKIYSECCRFIGNTTGPVISARVVRRILLDWLHFVRSAMHILLRCHFDVSKDTIVDQPHAHVFNHRSSQWGSNSASTLFLHPLQEPLPDDGEMLTSEMVMDHLVAVDLVALLQSASESFANANTTGEPILRDALVATSKKWLHALTHTTHVPGPGSDNALGFGSCDVATTLGAHIFDDTLCEALVGSRHYGPDNVRSVFVETGFLGYLTADWATEQFNDCNGIAVSTAAKSNNAKCLARRLGIFGSSENASYLRLVPLKRRKIYQFPVSYTMFHQKILSRCQFEYPAVCLTCGEILNAGNANQVSIICFCCILNF